MNVAKHELNDADTRKCNIFMLTTDVHFVVVVVVDVVSIVVDGTQLLILYIVHSNVWLLFLFFVDK